jgi:hypothetical protein
VTYKGISTILLLLTITVSSVASAEDKQDRIALLEQKIAQTKTRLELTEEQVQQITPILKASMESQKEILERYGIDVESRSRPEGKLGFRKARKLGKEMDAVRSETLNALSDYLDEQQITEFKKIQDERKQATRERIKASR